MKLLQKLKSEKARNVISFGVFITLILSCAYSIVHIVLAPSGAVAEQSVKLKSDYVLMLIQCILGLIVMMLPAIIERRLKIIMPNYMHICFVLFLYAGIYLGEVRSFYYLVPHWDTILHTFSGVMLGALGYAIVDMLNSQEKINVHMSPVFVALFAFCFAVAMGTIWEIYEFTVDRLLSLNMQKYAMENGTVLLGAEALMDTMKDLIVDTLGALVFTLIQLFGKLGRLKSKQQ